MFFNKNKSENKELIEWIVGTYELPKRLHKRIVYIACRRIEELALTSFDGQYRYIAELIEKFQIPYNERAAIRLDSHYLSSTKLWHEVIGTDGQPIEDEEHDLTLDNVFEIIRDGLDARGRLFLSELMKQNTNSYVHTTPEKLKSSIPRIARNLDSLAQRFEQNGQIALPKRRIAYVRFEPELKIEYKKRLSHEEVDTIIAAHKIYDGNATLTAKHLPWHPNTFIRQWRGVGLAIRPRNASLKPRYPPLENDAIEKIIQAHHTYKGIAQKAAKHLPWSVRTIKKYWEKAGLEISSKGFQPPLRQKDIDRVVAAYPIYKGNASKAAEALGYSDDVIIKYWKKAGLRIRERYEHDEKIDTDRIVEVYPIYKGNASKAAKDLHHKVETITKYWREAGLRTRKPGEHDHNIKIGGLVSS
jgi:hypothetical protein